MGRISEKFEADNLKVLKFVTVNESPAQKIRTVIQKIPKGRVATYGQIAALAGFPRHARQVGYALNALPEGDKTPWHRVINSEGRISPRGENGCDLIQRDLLEEEGIAFDESGRIDLGKYQWNPRLIKKLAVNKNGSERKPRR